MKQETKYETYNSVEVPESPLLKTERSNRYGSVPGLDDEELLDPVELERLIVEQEFGPVLTLPVKTKRNWITPAIDEDGTIEWGAFGTVDFDRHRPNFDKRLYKADRLNEEIANVRLIMEIISARIETTAKYTVIKYVSMGIIELGDISDFNLYCLAEYYLRAKRLQRDISKLREKSRSLREKRTALFMASS